MKIRLMQIEDYDAMIALWQSCEGMGMNEVDDSREGIARFLKRNPDTCFVAEEGGKLAGTIMTGQDGRRGYIYHTAVARGYRRLGVGKAMVDRALEALGRCGIHRVALLAFNSNEKGNAFWEQQGFILRTDLSYRNRDIPELVRYED